MMLVAYVYQLKITLQTREMAQRLGVRSALSEEPSCVLSPHTRQLMTAHAPGESLLTSSAPLCTCACLRVCTPTCTHIEKLFISAILKDPSRVLCDQPVPRRNLFPPLSTALYCHRLTSSYKKL